MVKKAEDHEAIVVRFYNASETAEIDSDTITFGKPVSHWQEVRMDEQPIKEQNLAVSGVKAELNTFRTSQVRTFMVRF